jgi:phage terminase large subunit GpA-like protein
MIQALEYSAGNLAQALHQVRSEVLKPPTTMSLIQWADSRRKLSREASSEPGQWKTNRVPVAFGPMAAVNDPHTHTITLMCCTQLMKTEFLLNVIGWTIDEDPVPMLFVIPTKDMAESISKERIDPMLRDTPSLADKVAGTTSRLHSNTMTHKAYPGGALNIVGANSPTEISSRPVCRVLFDEVDKYPASAGKEGDVIKLGEERTPRWWNRKHIRACSPSDEKTSKINREYKLSDQRKCYLKCPHCGHEQFLTWGHVKWAKDAHDQHLPETAEIHCEECGVGWTERERRKAIEAIEFEPDYGFRQTAEFFCCGEKRDPKKIRLWTEKGRSVCPECNQPSPYDGHAGFWASKLYDKIVHLPDLVRRWLAAVHSEDPNVLKTFINTSLAETFTYTASEVKAEALLERRLNYLTGQIPEGVNLLTVGADTQADRIECEVIGWGVDERSWSIEYEVFEGDPKLHAVWSALDQFLKRNWLRGDGRHLAIQAACIDSGGTATQRVYDFCNARRARRIWPIKGGTVLTNGDRRPVWPTSSGLQKHRTNTNVVIIGVDAAKDVLHSRMQIDNDGPGSMYFPSDREIDYFEQLTAERLVADTHRGRRITRWEVRSGRANEALDCRVYGYAALKGLIMRHRFKVGKDYSFYSGDHKPEPENTEPVRGEPVKKKRKRDRKPWLETNRNWLS